MGYNVKALLLGICIYGAGCSQSNSDFALSSDGVQIKYAVSGKGDISLVFVHGWSCNRSYWRDQSPVFEGDYQVVTIDLAGHGDSGSNRTIWTIDAFGEDVAAVVNKLKINRAVLIGHSMGGAVVVSAARLLPGTILGIVGVDTYQDISEKFSREEIEGWLAGFRNDFKKTTGDFVRSMFYPDADSSLVREIADDMSSAPASIGIGALENYFAYYLPDVFKDVRIPVFCINSDKYPINIEAGKQYAGSFQVSIMKGVGHFPMLEKPDQFNGLLKEALLRILNAG